MDRLTPNINNLSFNLQSAISRLDRYMEQSKIDIGDRLLILGVSELAFLSVKRENFQMINFDDIID